jgi:hypothetical protein
MLALPATDALAWPSGLMQCLARDARRLVPISLRSLLAERDVQIGEALARFPPELGRALAEDLSSGSLRAQTLAALDAHAREAVDLLRKRKTGEGLVRLGAVLRIPADLSDPVLSAGPEGYPAGVAREYYAFVESNLEKVPVVLDDPPALELRRADLPAYWQRLLASSRSQSAVIRTELFRNGRVVDHGRIDYRNPVFGVASLSYSRAVTAIAATWLALWREAQGDLTRRPSPIEVRPKEEPDR